VPRQAVQYIDGRDVVFIEHEGSFEMAAVATGRSDREHIEVVSGLEPGTPYAAEGAFQLKAALVTSAMGSHAGHGH
jgi:cobalt-zinc-cadmium efflux system membrane fusion protein